MRWEVLRETSRVLVALLALAGGGACGGGAGRQDDAGGLEGGAYPFGPRCSGTSDVSGSVGIDGGGVFSGSFVGADVVDSSCVTPPSGTVDVYFQDLATQDRFLFTLEATGDASGPTLLGSHTLVGAFTGSRSFQSVKTTGTVVVTAADDPRAVLTGDGGAVGAIAGTLSFVQDGFALSGSFQAPYCQRRACTGH